MASGFVSSRAEVLPSRNPLTAKEATFDVYHCAPGVSKDQLDWAKTVLPGLVTEGYFAISLELPDHMGQADYGLYGPSVGDLPVLEAEVFYGDTTGTGMMERLVDRPLRKTSTLQVVGTRTGDVFRILTVYGGPALPACPSDETPSDKANTPVREWWSVHALSSQLKG